MRNTADWISIILLSYKSLRRLGVPFTKGRLRILTVMFITIVISEATIVNGQVIRKNYREMTSKEKEVFCAALDVLKANGTIDALATLHSNNFTPIHNRPMFLPWHRWFDAQFERALQGTGVPGASKIALPYWDWTSQFHPATSSIPADNSKTSPLWTDPDFIGKYNTLWRLNRTSTGSNLGFSTTIASVLSNTNFATFADVLEYDLHNGPHGWVGGIMGGGSSPGDPVFFLHHNMVDKIWQNWQDLGGGRVSGPFVNSGTTTVATSMPTYPDINPHDIVDSRSPLLKVWFAENGRVLLNRYSVNGQENYRYTGAIKSEDFTVENSTTCTFLSAKEIDLTPGFSATTGSTFDAFIDTDHFNTARKEQVEVAIETNSPFGQENYKDFSEDDILVAPNPSSGEFNIVLLTNNKIDYQYTLYNSFGEIVTQNPSNVGKSIKFDLSDSSKGFYILKLVVNDKTFTKKLVLN